MVNPRTSSAPQANASATRGTRVLIVDDHALLRDGMRLMIENEPDLEVCGEAADEAEGAQLFRRLRPEVTIVDIALKSGNGIELIKRIKACEPTAKIIVSSMHDERIYGERALLAGALGYVSKQDPGGTLLLAIRRVLQGDMYCGEQLTQRLLRRVARAEEPAQFSPVELLADRELEAFRLIGKGLSSREIAARMHISQKTVDRYRENIKRKLMLASSSELIHCATIWVEQNL